MKIEQLEKETQTLTERIVGINNWIKANPQVADPNAYEILDCNVSLAETLAEYAKVENSQVLQEVSSKHSEIEPCYLSVVEMDVLRDTTHHPFFQNKEVNDLYCEVKKSQIFMNYDIPENMETKRIKKELLCKSMSVPFYIWQVHRTEPKYEYDNASEFNSMKAMLDIYKQEGNTQFVPQIEALFGIIEKNYKYSSQKVERHAK